MTKPVRLRQIAADDVDAALAHLVTDAGADVAARFVDAVERGLRQLARSPRSGSLRFSYDLDIPELRAWPLSRFPYLVFYVEGDHEVDVWRVLHTRRDIPANFAADETRAPGRGAPGTD